MPTLYARLNTLLLVLVLLVGLAIVSLLARDAFGGPLDPTGSPGSTMRPLDELSGAWSRKLAANDGSAGPNPPAGCNSSRFQCVLDNGGVLDRETGLVWARQADSGQSASWYGAQGVCADQGFSDRLGWRLPTVEELASLVDYNASNPALPPGHPFVLVQSAPYWTSSEFPGDPNLGMTIDIVDPFGYATYSEQKATLGRMWCVRG